MTVRRPTSADVAERAGVSRTTVSFVLNGRAGVTIPTATRQRVLDAATALGYHPHGPARQLAGGASHTLGLVLLQSAEQVAGDALLADTLRGLAAAARSRDYRVLVETLEPRGGSYAGLLREAHCDGLVISGPRVDDNELIALVEDDFPMVIQGFLPTIPAPSVPRIRRNAVFPSSAASSAGGSLVDLASTRLCCALPSTVSALSRKTPSTHS